MPTSSSSSLDRRSLLTGGLGALAAGTVLSGCSARAEPRADRTHLVRYQGWSGEVLYPELAEDLGLLGDVRLSWIGNTTSGPQDIQAALTGDVDVGGAFNGAIVRLAARGAPLTSVISYYGADPLTLCGFYAPEHSPIRGPRDLVGKTVGVNTLGAHHEDVLHMYLERGGLTPEEIRSVQLVVVPPVSAEQALRSGQLDVAALSDYRRDKALSRGGLRELFSDHQLLGTFSAGCYVVRDSFLAENPETTGKLVAGTAHAIRWAQTRPREVVVQRMVDIIRERGRNEDDSSVRYWKSPGIAGPGGIIHDREFRIWKQRCEIDGRIPPGGVRVPDLYSNDFNPYRTTG